MTRRFYKTRRDRRAELLDAARPGLAIMPEDLKRRMCKLYRVATPEHLPARSLQAIYDTWGATAICRMLEERARERAQADGGAW